MPKQRVWTAQKIKRLTELCREGKTSPEDMGDLLGQTTGSIKAAVIKYRLGKRATFGNPIPIHWEGKLAAMKAIIHADVLKIMRDPLSSIHAPYPD